MAKKKESVAAVEGQIFNAASPVFIIGAGAVGSYEGQQCLVITGAYRQHLYATAMFFASPLFYNSEKDQNQADDFRRFSGKIFTSVEIEHSHIEQVQLKPQHEIHQAIELARLLGAGDVVIDAAWPKDIHEASVINADDFKNYEGVFSLTENQFLPTLIKE